MAHCAARHCRTLPLSFLPSALALAAAQLAATAPLLLASGAAQAQTAPARSFDIPAGPLEDALNRFGQDAGLVLAFAPETVAGLKSAGLKGSHSVRSGLDALLQGTGVRAVQQPNGVYVFQRQAPVAQAAGAAPVRSLAEIRVQARRAANGTTEGTGSYTNQITSIASKTDQSFREIPQSVSVITRQLMDDKKVVDVEQALALTPGVIVADNSGRYYSRGFQVTSMQVDGGAPLALGAYTYQPQQDMAFYDRVEVMRGASGLLGGVGDPGGIINLVRKKPLAQAQVDVSLSAGSWDQRRTEIDVTGPLNAERSVRGRAVLAYQDGNSYFDYVSQEKPSLYGVLEADLTPSTLLTVGASYGKVKQTGDYAGLPRFTDGRDLGLPAHTVFSNDWSFFHYKNQEVFAQLAHRFDNHWQLKFNASHAQTEQNRQWSTLSGPVDPQTLTGPVWRGGLLDSSNTQDIVDFNLSGPFTALGRTHELLLGLDWQRVRSHWQNLSFADSGTVGANVFDMRPWTPQFDQFNLNLSERYAPWGQEQVGGYGVLRLNPSDRLHVIVGARVSRYKFTQTMSDILDAAGSTRPWSAKSFEEKAKVTPYGGVIYDLTPQWSAYASYSSIFKPQALMMSGPQPGAPLAPIKGKSYEAGLKGELMDGKLNATFSMFNVERTGTAVLDERYAEDYSLWGASCCYLPQGKVTSQGFDVEVGGQLAAGWQVAAGYTFNKTRDKTENAIYSSITPRHLLKLSTVYTLPGEWSRWRVGGSGRVQSAQFVSGTVTNAGGATANYDFTQPGHALWDLMLQYRIDPHWSLSLNVNNVLDKRYYQTVSSIYSGNMQGLPRNAMVTLRGTF
ncbi:TonB-dependent receptor [Acidovorax sp. CCYZU-2555]|uniref:TonB-dependent siderophore receptor n=1 Tax=Acidovorax sp. CCYZU-2555 TaxID=2835042 RepID=UPI001BCE4B8E|nr:TonB-dependent receptor [Acidovorax sp. CCYZU-2555]MBS7780913.1 TonB-dependent siderophore receptor [Acidovorax sp. CCYZU-2555]